MENITFLRGQAQQDSLREFNGLLYTTTFRLKKCAELSQVDFFGHSPTLNSNEQPCQFRISLMIKQSMSKYQTIPDKELKIFLPETKFSISAFGGDVLAISFNANKQENVKIPGDMWFDVLFEIEGPPTGHLRDQDIYVERLRDLSERFEIDHKAGSSRQLKALHFCMWTA